MSTKHGVIRSHRFHGDATRFQAWAEFMADTYAGNVPIIADVGGGQGMLALMLNKRYNFNSLLQFLVKRREIGQRCVISYNRAV